MADVVSDIDEDQETPPRPSKTRLILGRCLVLGLAALFSLGFITLHVEAYRLAVWGIPTEARVRFVRETKMGVRRGYEYAFTFAGHTKLRTRFHPVPNATVNVLYDSANPRNFQLAQRGDSMLTIIGSFWEGQWWMEGMFFGFVLMLWAICVNSFRGKAFGPASLRTGPRPPAA